MPARGRRVPCSQAVSSAPPSCCHPIPLLQSATRAAGFAGLQALRAGGRPKAAAMRGRTQDAIERGHDRAPAPKPLPGELRPLPTWRKKKATAAQFPATFSRLNSPKEPLRLWRAWGLAPFLLPVAWTEALQSQQNLLGVSTERCRPSHKQGHILRHYRRQRHAELCHWHSQVQARPPLPGPAASRWVASRR